MMGIYGHTDVRTGNNDDAMHNIVCISRIYNDENYSKISADSCRRFTYSTISCTIQTFIPLLCINQFTD